MTRIAADAGAKWRCFGFNMNGSPQHPLYQPLVTPLVDYPRSTP